MVLSFNASLFDTRPCFPLYSLALQYGALVVGLSCWIGRRTGNSGAIPGRPRRCNRVLGRLLIFLGHCRSELQGYATRRPSKPQLGSQKTYQRVAGGDRRGTEPQHRGRTQVNPCYFVMEDE